MRVKAADGQHVTDTVPKSVANPIASTLISILLRHVIPEVKIILRTALITSEFSAERNSC